MVVIVTSEVTYLIMQWDQTSPPLLWKNEHTTENITFPQTTNAGGKRDLPDHCYWGHSLDVPSLVCLLYRTQANPRSETVPKSKNLKILSFCFLDISSFSHQLGKY